MGATSSSSTPRDGGRSGGGVHDTYTPSTCPPRVTPILYHTNHTKADNVTLHPAADGSTRITSPRILLTIGERIRWNFTTTPPSLGAGRKSITYNIMCFITFPKFDGFFY